MTAAIVLPEISPIAVFIGLWALVVIGLLAYIARRTP